MGAVRRLYGGGLPPSTRIIEIVLWYEIVPVVPVVVAEEKKY